MDIQLALNIPDQEAVDPLGQHVENIINTMNGVRHRPGQEAFIDLGTAEKVNGLYYWEANEKVIACSGGEVHSITYSDSGGSSFFLLETGDKLLLEDSGRLLLESVTTDTDVSGAVPIGALARVTFADFGSTLYMAAGGIIQELHSEQSFVSHGGNDYTCILNNIAIEPGVTAGWATYWQDDGAGTTYDAWLSSLRYGSGTADILEDAEASLLTEVYFIETIDTYLLALEPNTERMFFSKVGDPWDFDSEWLSAEQKPDDANCMIVKGNDIYIGGTRTIEMMNNNGSTPFIPSGYGAIEHGVHAPYSFTFCPILGTFLFIDDKRRLVKLQGMDIVVVNRSIDTFLHRVPTVTDAIGDYAVVDGKPYYYLQFPNSDQSITVNLTDMSWSEDTHVRDGITHRFNAACVINATGWDDLVLIGDTTDGTIKSLSIDVQDDEGVPFSSIIRSQRIQSPDLVPVRKLAFGLSKVSKTTASSAASLTVRWRDDGQDWGVVRTVTIADDSKTDAVENVRRCGSYDRTRQYEIDMTGIFPYAIQRLEQT